MELVCKNRFAGIGLNGLVWLDVFECVYLNELICICLKGLVCRICFELVYVKALIWEICLMVALLIYSMGLCWRHLIVGIPLNGFLMHLFDCVVLKGCLWWHWVAGFIWVNLFARIYVGGFIWGIGLNDFMWDAFIWMYLCDWCHLGGFVWKGCDWKNLLGWIGYMAFVWMHKAHEIYVQEFVWGQSLGGIHLNECHCIGLFAWFYLHGFIRSNVYVVRSCMSMHSCKGSVWHGLASKRGRPCIRTLAHIWGRRVVRKY